MSDNAPRETRAERKRRLMVQFNAALLTCATVAQAAKSCGVSARQATRWLRSPEFRQAYVESQTGSPQAMLGLSRAASLPALERLAKIIRDDNSAPTAAVGAAKVVLDLAQQLAEAQELESRIQALEALAGGQK